MEDFFQLVPAFRVSVLPFSGIKKAFRFRVPAVPVQDNSDMIGGMPLTRFTLKPFLIQEVEQLFNLLFDEL